MGLVLYCLHVYWRCVVQALMPQSKPVTRNLFSPFARPPHLHLIGVTTVQLLKVTATKALSENWILSLFLGILFSTPAIDLRRWLTFWAYVAAAHPSPGCQASPTASWWLPSGCGHQLTQRSSVVNRCDLKLWSSQLWIVPHNGNRYGFTSLWNCASSKGRRPCYVSNIRPTICSRQENGSYPQVRKVR